MCAWKPTTCQALCGALDGSLRTGTLILLLKRAAGASSSTGSICDTSLLPRLQNPANHLVENYSRSGFCLMYMWVPCTLKALLIFCVGVKWIFISWSDIYLTWELKQAQRDSTTAWNQELFDISYCHLKIIWPWSMNSKIFPLWPKKKKKKL